MRNYKRFFNQAGIIGPIFYFSILTFLGLLWKGYDPIATGMSELGAIDSPVKNYMNYLGFLALGICISLFSVGLYLNFKKYVQLSIASGLVFLGGIGMIAVSFLPCDSLCIDVSTTGRLHSIASSIPAISIPLAALITALPLSKIWGKHWGYFSFLCGALSMILGPIMLIGVFDSITGVIQRLGIGLSLLWMSAVSIKITTTKQKQ